MFFLFDRIQYALCSVLNSFNLPVLLCGTTYVFFSKCLAIGTYQMRSGRLILKPSLLLHLVPNELNDVQSSDR